MASIVAVSVTLWMLTGYFGGTGPSTDANAENAERTQAHSTLNRVAVQMSMAQTINREIVVSGRTEPNREVSLRAETEGKVIELFAERGTVVRSGEKIAVLDMRDRSARLEEAKAIIKQRELELDGAKKLKNQQFVSDTQIAEAFARLVSAQAALENIELDITHTILTAPFEAIMQERLVELGDYVKSGDTVAQLVDTDPLIVVGEINERDVATIETGGAGRAKLVNGDLVDGYIRYISPVADEKTRTFRVELAIENRHGMLRAGMTAEIRLDGEKSVVHSFSPALLALDDDGTIGVKVVDDAETVRFYPVQIIASSDAGISVTGLPDKVRLIVVGQGFVKAGEKVIPVINPSPAGLNQAESSGLSENIIHSNVPKG